MSWTEEVYRIHDFDPGELAPGSAEHVARSLECYAPEDRPAVLAAFQRCVEQGQPYDLEFPFTTARGRRLWIRTMAEAVLDQGRVTKVVGNIMDITERKQAEEGLAESERRFHSLFENMLHGFAYCRMLFEDNRPQDFIYLAVNSAFEKLTGLKNVGGKRVSEVIPDIRESHPELFEIYGRVALGGPPERLELYFKPLKSWLSISVYSKEKEHFAAVFDNTTERKRGEEALTQRTRQLEAIRVVTAEMTRELDLPTLSALINRRAAELVGATSGTVYLWDEQAELLIPVAWYGLGEWVKDRRFRLGEGVAGTVAQRREGMIVNDYRTSPYANPTILEARTDECRAWRATPISGSAARYTHG
jgi:PAS domain-containing protein